MAGNNSIQFLRGTSSQIASSTEIALAGQPVFNLTNRRLYIGDGSTQIKNLTAIRADQADKDGNGNNIASTYAKVSSSSQNISFNVNGSGVESNSQIPITIYVNKGSTSVNVYSGILANTDNTMLCIAGYLVHDYSGQGEWGWSVYSSKCLLQLDGADFSNSFEGQSLDISSLQLEIVDINHYITFGKLTISTASVSGFNCGNSSSGKQTVSLTTSWQRDSSGGSNTSSNYDITISQLSGTVTYKRTYIY